MGKLPKKDLEVMIVNTIKHSRNRVEKKRETFLKGLEK